MADATPAGRPDNTAVTAAGLDLTAASRFATLALSNIAREYPHKLDHTMAGDADARAPRALHPAFHGSYDWHSCVHMHWLLARILRRFPNVPVRSSIEAVFDRSLAPGTIADELAYARRPSSAARRGSRRRERARCGTGRRD